MRTMNDELLAVRGRELVDNNETNGMKRLFVRLFPDENPPHAQLDVEFHNDVAVNDIANQTVGDVFTLRGGTRILGGEAPERLHISEVAPGANGNSLVLTTSGIGDYSTYTLNVAYSDTDAELPRTLIDPLFADLPFKFRPGCFNLNCAPAPTLAAPPAAQPVVDYLARDFDSIKHVLINAMRDRVPGWEPTSEADMDMVLLDLLAADADELCDFQDRVMQEAYLGTARKRVSLARHARLMDYHIHQGNQAGTWLVAEVTDEPPAEYLVAVGTGVWTGDAWSAPGAITFIASEERNCYADLNELSLYTWDGVVTELEAGATEAELAVPPGSDAATLCSHLRATGHLVIEEKLNAETGIVNGRDITKRQLLRLLPAEAAAEEGFDPVAKVSFVRARWEPADRLTQQYCFVLHRPDQPSTQGISAFHGNVIYATHGRPHQVVFRPPGAELGLSDDKSFIRYDEASWEPSAWGATAIVPHRPLAYRETLPGGDAPPESTAVVSVDGSPWRERIDLIESEGGDAHFLIETDEAGSSRLRFGNAPNGRPLDADATVTCEYQVGGGSAGNVGADSLTGFDPSLAPGVVSFRNPFDVVNGRDPEPRDEIIRRAPNAYRYRQLRAVTPADYVDRAEELPEVAHAFARFAWTGSWRTVQVSIDPPGSTELDETTRVEIAAHLDAVRLINDDLEVRPARYVALDVLLRLCALPEFWPEDLEVELQQAFSDSYAPDGRAGFFNPDLWTFGQPLHASQIMGRALEVPGVERVLALSMRRWNAGSGLTTSEVAVEPGDLPEALVDRIDVQPFEIVQVANDPNHLERGRVLFDIRGGRR